MNKKTNNQMFHMLMKVMLLLLITITAKTQVTQQWVNRYNGSGNNADFPYKVVVDKFTGNIYVTGSSIGSSGTYDIVTIKYNSAGSQQWSISYNGTGNGADTPIDMIADKSGNVIITGSSKGINSGIDCITIKYDKDGHRVWSKIYNGTGNGNDYGWTLSQDFSGGIVITGRSIGSISGMNTGDDIITIKYNYFGDQEWVQRYNGINNLQDVAYSVVTDANNNVYVAGTSSTLNNYGDFVTLKYDAQGSIVWVKKLESPNNDFAYKILNNYQFGEICTIGKNGSNTVIICYDYSGNILWQTSDYGAISSFSSAALDNSGNIFLCGNTYVNGTSDFAIIAYNSSGALAWFNTYNGPGSGYDYAKDITIDNLDNIYLTGNSQGAGSGYDYATIKFAQNGALQWEKRYNFTGVSNNYPASIASDNNGNIFVTGYSQNVAGNYDFATIKYKQGSLLSKGSNEIPAEFKLHQNYPNPFNPSTDIRFDVSQSGNVKIAVYDMLGREIQILADEFKDAGSYEISFNASHLSSGTYFYKLTLGGFTDIKKMVLIK